MGESGQHHPGAEGTVVGLPDHSPALPRSRFARPRESGSPASDFPSDLNFLAVAGMAAATLHRAVASAAQRTIAPSEALIRSGAIPRETYDEMLAARLAVPYANAIPPPLAGEAGPNVPLTEEGAIPDLPLIAGHGRNRRLHVSPQRAGAARLLEKSETMPGAMRRIAIAGSATLRLAHLERMRQAMVARAGGWLEASAPAFSARTRVTGGQAAFAVIATAACCAAALAAGSKPSLLALGVALSVFYLSCVLLRASILARLDLLPPSQAFRPSPTAPEDFPRYSVLVALYDEAGQVGPLVAALGDLQWPADRLEAFLVCEEDDKDTLAAFSALELPANFHVVACPPSLPRTKPKALNYALPLASGEFLVIYDAEDRPHPLQLREAWETFRSGGGDLACLQAPLEIHNRRQNWLTALFAIEYDTLFRGILPVLERMGGPLPLGGTSNHFRLDALRRAGGWDPWNVTEDADLGIRLARLGMRCGTITLPTLEEAPPHLRVWLRQRTRWFKGWIQTILVHTRAPRLLHRQLGGRGTAIFYTMLAATVLSALIHPFFLLQVAMNTVTLGGRPPMEAGDLALLAVGIFNLVAGYLVYGLLAREVALRRNRPGAVALLCTLPAYWVLMSWAAWRAVLQFVLRPFHWEKTAHGLSNIAPDDNMGSGGRG